MTIFSEKLDRIAETVAMADPEVIAALGRVIGNGRSKMAVAVGSGGSAVAAEFLASCRASLQGGATLVQTPLQFTLGTEDLGEVQVWLFSARGENADVVAALAAATSRGAHDIQVMTSNPDGTLAQLAKDHSRAVVHVLPVAEQRDGFLATHSLFAATTATLLASEAYTHSSVAERDVGALAALTEERLTAARRSEAKVIPPRPGDCVILLGDPRLGPATLLIETSIWEAALCPVQRTDFRNFAHGRHTWLARRPWETFIFALTGADTRGVWTEIDAYVPADVRRRELRYSHCGRRELFGSLLDAFAAVEAMAMPFGIDPGKPGAGSFARPMYEGRALEQLAAKLSPSLRHKRAAVAAGDPPDVARGDLEVAEAGMRARFGAAQFGGLVLDYDGTLVANGHSRLEPPRPDILSELERLLDHGLRIALATGRGGSAGEMLRNRLAPRHHESVLVGYYNGAYLKPLSVDIRNHPPDPHPAIAAVAQWAAARRFDFVSPKLKDSGVQVSIDLADLRDPDAFKRDLDAFCRADGNRVRIVRSQHSIDVLPTETCKTSVVDTIVAGLPDDGNATDILCIGDSGAVGGNDHLLLGLPFGVSVGDVCPRPDVCWSFFGPAAIGPDALVRILRALHPNAAGAGMRLDMSSLGLVLHGSDVYKGRVVEVGTT